MVDFIFYLGILQNNCRKPCLNSSIGEDELSQLSVERFRQNF